MHVSVQFAKYSFSTSRVNNKISNNNSNDNDLSRWLTSTLILLSVQNLLLAGFYRWKTDVKQLVQVRFDAGSFYLIMPLSDLVNSASWDNNSVIKYLSLQTSPFPLNCLDPEVRYPVAMC